MLVTVGHDNAGAVSFAHLALSSTTSSSSSAANPLPLGVDLVLAQVHVVVVELLAGVEVQILVLGGDVPLIEILVQGGDLFR